MTTSLKDQNLQFAAMKLLESVVSDAVKALKAEHLEALSESAEQTDSTSWAVKVGDVKVATITLQSKSPALMVADEAALVDAIVDSHPDMVERRLKPWAVKQLLDTVTVDDDGVAVTPDGEVLPGVVMSPPGTTYQSVRWDTKNAGKQVMADAIQAGHLRSLLADAGLPAIGAQ